jgi:hypothetical protein
VVLLFQTSSFQLLPMPRRKNPPLSPATGVLNESGRKSFACPVTGAVLELSRTDIKNYTSETTRQFRSSVCPVACLSGRVPVRSSTCPVEYSRQQTYWAQRPRFRARRTAIIKIEFAFVHFLLIGCNSLFSLSLSLSMCWFVGKALGRKGSSLHNKLLKLCSKNYW